MQADWPILSVLLWLPIAAGLLLLLAGERSAAAARWLALLASVATFVVSVVLWRDFDTSTAAMQFVERQPWIGAFNAWYHLGVDGISMPLIVLTAFITPLVVIAGWTVIENRVKTYFALLLVLETFMVGVFAATDVFLFYVFFEATLIPVYFLVAGYGGPQRVRAAVKFLLWSLAGGLVMLAAVVGLYAVSAAAGEPSYLE